MGAPAAIVLDGANNFRDLGGLPTRDGRRVRAGALFRSDALSSLTDTDHARLDALGLTSICDLRDEAERARHPNRLPTPSGITQHAIGFLPIGGHAMLAGLGATTAADDVHAALEDYYRRFALEHADNFARLFQILLAPDSLPLLLHCTSGKDRTGFGIALILSALGVGRDIIQTDYLRSNEHPRDLRALVAEDIHPDALHALMCVRSSYLDAAFAAIEGEWGGIDAFLEHAIGLDGDQREHLRSRLLVTP